MWIVCPALWLLIERIGVQSANVYHARKRQFTPRQLAIAEERLRSQGWLSVEVALPH